MQLQIRDLSQTYADGTAALKRVSLTIPQGMFALLGPRGAGKSTLMRILATLQAPSRGSIRLGGIDLLGQPDAIRPALGYLPQESGVYPAVNAEDLLGHFALLRGFARHWQRRELVEALLARMGLWESRRQGVGSYPPALRLRFGIAAAMLGNPQLLLVDAPIALLEAAERRRLLELLAELGEGRILVLSADILEDVGELCAGVAVIDRGRIVFEQLSAAARRLRSVPQHAGTPAPAPAALVRTRPTGNW